MKFIKFPSIEQYRKVVKSVSDRANFTGLDEAGEATYNIYANKPVINFLQTVKIHGTNAGVTLTVSGEYGQQSRNRLITEDSDNHGFALWCNNISRKQYFTQFLQNVLDCYDENIVEQVTIYGEFAGQGIFSGVAVGELPKSFYAFSISLLHKDGTITKLNQSLLKHFRNEELLLFNILMFDHKQVSIDFNSPDLAINSIISDTNKVENGCPVGKYFGVLGVGEGVVLLSNCGEFIFKSKGDKHSVSKVKTMPKVDTEMLGNVQEFVAAVVTENRLVQGIEYLKEMQFEMSPKSTGEYIKWVTQDVKKEEMDNILSNQLDFKILTHQISKKSRDFFFEHLDSLFRNSINKD